MKLNKIDVAQRQLDTAIELFFGGKDVVSVHTLAAASATVLADVLDNSGSTSWRQQMIDDNKRLSKTEILRILRKAQNFFKHADKDPSAEIEFNEFDNDLMLFVATLEFGLTINQGVKGSRPSKYLTLPMSAFQIWHLATRMNHDFVPYRLRKLVHEWLPNIKNAPRFDQLAQGAMLLKKVRGLQNQDPSEPEMKSLIDPRYFQLES